MKNFFKLTLILLTFYSFTISSSKAWIADIWFIEDMDAQELSTATESFKEKALAAGAKMKNIRSASKVRGDSPGNSTIVIAYYESYEDLMHDITLNSQQPDMFDSTYGQINQDARSDNAIFSKDLPFMVNL